MSATTQRPDVRPSPALRLSTFSIERLFGEFSYVIPLNLKSHVTAIIAPNGTGKTLCLRIINGLFAEKWSVFSDNIFAKATYIFTDGTSIVIEREAEQCESEPAGRKRTFRLTVINSDGRLVAEWSPNLVDPKRSMQVERYLPFLTRIGPATWRHDHTGEMLGFQQVIETFGDSIPEPIKKAIYENKPPILTEITSKIDCHLIETQRLLILRETDSDQYYRPGRRAPSELAIERKALALKEIISQQINVYATLSQSLDRSFPRRVIGQVNMFSPDDLKKQLHDLDEKRVELMEAGILDTEADDPVSLPEGQLETAIARVLTVYSEDTKRKLSSLSNLLAKIKLFKELIDQRFVTKEVRITRKNGFEVMFKGRAVPIERLSSGEQHQLVLFFELLFQINQNSLILIDEPELSLHVAWQKKFIGDLMKIIDLNKFDVLLATHSPQLIGRWADLTVDLGDVDEQVNGGEIEESRNEVN